MDEEKRIDKLAEKLYPLMPSVIEGIMRKRELPDKTLRQDMSEKILRLATAHLGSYREKLLLSLPSEKMIRGELNLGSVLYEKDKWQAGITKQELTQNLSIFGRSGSGKTNAVFHLIMQLLNKKIPFLFMDFKRTARHLIPSTKKKLHVYTPGRSIAAFPFNVFVMPPGLEAEVYINQLLDIMGDAFLLKEGSISLLQKAILACYKEGNQSPSVDDVKAKIDEVEDRNRLTGWKLSATRALEQIQFAGLSSSDVVSQRQLVEILLGQNTIIELDGLSLSSKRFLVPLVCVWLYYVRLAQREREQLKIVIVIEEAHHVLHRTSGRETIMEMLLRQCRELGIGVIVIDQHPSLISSAVLANTYTTLCLNVKEPSDVRKAGDALLLDEHERKHLNMLPTGQAICKLQDRWTRPFLVQVPHVRVAKGEITDEMIREFASLPSSYRNDKARSIASWAFTGFPISDYQLKDRDLVFIRDVLDFPDAGVKERYKRLDLSFGPAHAMKERLVATGWLDSKMVEVGRTRKQVLALSAAAREFLGIDGGISDTRSSRGGLEHQYYQRLYHRLLADRGYVADLETAIEGGILDVTGFKDNAELDRPDEEPVRIAIQVETGSSTIVKNVQLALGASFDKVLCVATSGRAYKTAVRLLSDAGLLISNRVRVALREQFPEDWIL